MSGNIYLVGIMGSGKTTVGRALAKRLKRDFVDSDAEIEKAMGLTVARIFEKFGEERFREAESEAIERISARHGTVVACGGGAALRERNVSAMKKAGIIVYLRRPAGDILKHVRRDTRPLLNDDESFLRMYSEREPIYERCADITVWNRGRFNKAVDAIIEKLPPDAKY